jgi:predicted nucleic acid-binding protein
LLGLLENDVDVAIPEIANYELRRELIRAKKSKGLAKLEELIRTLDYLCIDTGTMYLAADYWATARNKGKPTADCEALDGDMILCAQANKISDTQRRSIIATTNVGHLSIFSQADNWDGIAP